MKKKILTGLLSSCFIVPSVFCLSACNQSPEIEFKVTDGYVQYYDGTTWKQLISIEQLEGTDADVWTIGDDGFWYRNGEKTDNKSTGDVGATGNGIKTIAPSTDPSKTDETKTTYIITLDDDSSYEFTVQNGTNGSNADVYTIGDDGYWYKNGDKTEYKAIGDDAAKYTIGLDGYWYKNGQKTKYKAIGADGDQYTIGNDGYWYKNGDKTDYQAIGQDATAATYTITYDYGKAAELFKTSQESDSINSSQWLTTLPEIKEEYADAFLGWYIEGTNKQINKYDFVGGSVTLEAKFDAEKTGVSGCYKQGKYVMTWQELLEAYPAAFLSSNTEIKGDTSYVNYRSYLLSLEGELVIDSSITKIGKGAFADCDQLTKVVIPNTVSSIGKNAFYECLMLEKIDMPDSVTTLEDSAFAGCIALKSAKLSAGLTSTANNSFYGCTSLSEVQLPDSIVTVGSYAFYGCSSFKTIKLPKTTTTIMNNAFEDCVSLEELEIPESVTAISPFAFNNSAIKELTIPENLKQIYAGTFLGLKDVEKINFNSINMNDLSYNSDMDVFENVGANVDTVVINIGANVEKIPNYLFNLYRTTADNDDYDTKFVVNFSSAVKCTSIGISSFGHLETAESVILPNHITSIGRYAFGYWYDLTSVYFYGTEEEWNAITIDESDSYFPDATKYYYSATKPSAEGNYWHFDVDGKTPLAW